MLKLFSGYRAATDSKFVEYIETKEELYLDANDQDEDKLMQLALNNYIMRKKTNNGKFHMLNKNSS